MTQWFSGPIESLVELLNAIVGRIDDLSQDEIIDDQNNLIENNVFLAIFAHQKDIKIGDYGHTVLNRFQDEIPITSNYINSIISKRFFYQDHLKSKKKEIEEVAEKIYDFLIKEKIPQEVIDNIYATNMNPDIRDLNDFKEKIIKNIISFYPFHPFLFSETMKKVFNKYSTEDRGILNYVNKCFTKYESLLDNDVLDLINIDNFFLILNEDTQLFKYNEELEEIYKRLEKSRKKKDPDDLISEKIIKSLILKYLSEVEEPKFSKDELKAIFMLFDHDYKNINEFVDYCIETENISDIISDEQSVELTLSKTEPIKLYLQRIKKVIEEKHVYQYIQEQHRDKHQKIQFRPSETKNLRIKKYEFIDYDTTIEDIISHIKSKTNTFNPLAGKAKTYHFDVIDLIYYFLPPKSTFLSRTFDPKKEIIDKITDVNINYVICKPNKAIFQFEDYERIQGTISLHILNWVLTTLKEIKKGNEETLYKDFIAKDQLPVPDYSKISDLISELTRKNQSIIESLRTQAKSLIQDIKETRIEKWKENHTCYYNFSSYEEVIYSDDSLLEIEEDFETFRFPDAIKLDDYLAHTSSSKIWDVIRKEFDDITSATTIKQLNIAVENLKLLTCKEKTFSLENETNINSSYKELEKEANKINDKEEVLKFCYDLRMNKLGLSIFLSALGIFYLYQKGKIKLYKSDNTPVNMETVEGNKKILETLTNFTSIFIKKQGKIGKKERIPSKRWEFTIDKVIEFHEKKIIEINLEYNDGSPIDLYALKRSQSLDRDRKLKEILRNHTSSDKLVSLNNKIKLFLKGIKFDKNQEIIKKLGLEFLIEIISKLKKSETVDNVFELLDKNQDKLLPIFIYFDKLESFSEDKLSKLEEIISKYDNIDF